MRFNNWVPQFNIWSIDSEVCSRFDWMYIWFADQYYRTWSQLTADVQNIGDLLEYEKMEYSNISGEAICILYRMFQHCLSFLRYDQNLRSSIKSCYFDIRRKMNFEINDQILYFIWNKNKIE